MDMEMINRLNEAIDAAFTDCLECRAFKDALTLIETKALLSKVPPDAPEASIMLDYLSPIFSVIDPTEPQ